MLEDSFDLSSPVDTASYEQAAWTYGYEADQFTDRVLGIQVSWTYPGYPGYWYEYVKSPSAHSNYNQDPNDDLYRFDPARPLPANPYGGGYRIGG